MKCSRGNQRSQHFLAQGDGNGGAAVDIVRSAVRTHWSGVCYWVLAKARAGLSKRNLNMFILTGEWGVVHVNLGLH